MPTLRQFCSDFLRFDRRAIVVMTLLLMLAAALEGAGLMLLVTVLKAAIPEQTASEALPGWLSLLPGKETLPWVLSLFLLTVVIQSAARCFADTGCNALRQRFVDHLRQQLFDAIADARWHYLMQRNQSEFVAVLTTDIARVAMGVQGVLQLIIGVSLGLIYLGFSFGLSVPMTLTALVCGCVLAFGMRRQNKRAVLTGKRLTLANKGLQHHLQDYLACLKTIKSHHQEALHKQRFASRLSEAFQVQHQFIRNQARSQFGFKLGAATCLCVLIFTASRNSGLSTGSILLLVIIFARLMPVLSALLLNWQQISFMLPAYQHYLDLCNQLAQSDQRYSEESARLDFTDSISFHEVRFAYAGKPPVVNQLKLRIPKNKTTVIIGPSGAGKSTLIDLLTGLLQPDEGVIKIDNQVLDGETCAAWQKQVAFVGQDPVLFNDTIRNNLCWMTPSASEDEVRLALQAAAADFVYALPDGLDTQVGDRGARLSGGERQRLLLARALIGQPSLLILDEVTSAVDEQNRRIIFNALSQITRSLTVVIVTHQLEYLELADQVIDLSKHRKVEQVLAI